MTRFVILAVPRTGSNLLCTLLNSQPRILCHHEVFNPQGVFTAQGYGGDGLNVETLQQRDDHPLEFLDRVWQTGADGLCVGFKWTRGQNEEVLTSVLQDTRVKKIVLRRLNRIKIFVSEKIAQQTQQWEVYSRNELTLPRLKIHVDAEELREHIAMNRRCYDEWSAELARLRQPCLEVDYETLFDASVHESLLGYLGVEPAPMIATSVKQNPTDLREMIANFDELANGLPSDELKTELHDCGM